MNVKIGYTVDLSEVPGESKRLLKNVAYSLQDDISNKLLMQDFNPIVAVEKIEEFREKLIKYDQQLQDCYDILRGYISASGQVAEEPSSEILSEEIKKSMEELAKIQNEIVSQESNE
jgi:hypothetical protein